MIVMEIAISAEAYEAIARTLAGQIIALTAAAFACGISTAHAAEPLSARLTEPLVAKLAEVDDAVKDVAPQYGCYDQTDPKTCQQKRMAFTSGGTFATFDFPEGSRVRCFSPGIGLRYRVCGSGDMVRPEIFDGSDWIEAPSGDPRCEHWGNPFTAEYLACEAAQPPKSTTAPQDRSPECREIWLRGGEMPNSCFGPVK
jgi:hypothetical protein